VSKKTSFAVVSATVLAAARTIAGCKQLLSYVKAIVTHQKQYACGHGPEARLGVLLRRTPNLTETTT
jgi:hypothetical protein